MKPSNHNSDTIFNPETYTITWSDIENADIDYENYLDDIESFFREDVEEDAHLSDDLKELEKYN